MEESRIALIGIIVEDLSEITRVNELLHTYNAAIVGRMGIPYRDKDVYIISIALDGTNSLISALSGKLGMIKGISVKTIYAKTTKTT